VFPSADKQTPPVGDDPASSPPMNVTVASVRAYLIRWFPIKSAEIFAEPWRRLAASGIDLAIIALIHVTIVGYLIVQSQFTDSAQRILLTASPIFCWLYALIGWRLGRTLGMRACGIRIVTDQFGPITWRIAVTRIGGYMLACLPVKLGLLPILTGERRQGWHDRIAGTIVVKDSASLPAPLPEIRPRTLLPIPPAPDFRLPWGGALAALLLYTLLTVAMTWPTVRHIDTRIIGETADPYIFLWNYWYFASALHAHLPTTSTDLIFHPRTVSLGLHTMQWFNCLLAVPLQRHYNLVATYNILNLVSLTATAFTAYWAITAIVRSRIVGIIAGMAFGYAPYFTAHLMGHANLVAAEFVPLYVLCAYATLVTGRARYAAWSGIWLALAGLCDLQYLMFCVLFSAIAAIALPLYYERPSRSEQIKRIALLALGGVIAAMILSPILLAAARDLGEGGQDKSRVGGAFRADLADWFFPGMMSYFTGAHRVLNHTVESSVTPGFAFIILAIVALVRCRRQTIAWTFVAFVFAVFASGPFLTLHARGLPAPIMLFLAFPGNLFDLPWNTQHLVYGATEFCANPAAVFNEWYSVAMPFSWLPSVVPLLKPFRVPVRFGMMVDLVVIVMGSFGLRSLMAIMTSRFDRRASYAVATGSALLVLAQCYSAPYPSFVPATMPFYEALGRDTDRYAIVEIGTEKSELSAYGQTLHHKPLVRSFISRCPANVMAQAAHINDRALRVLRQPDTPESPASKELQELRALNIRYIVVFDGPRQGPGKGHLADKRLAYSDEQISAYRIDGVRPPKLVAQKSP
jgi:uncharacterized RDD family membrane protein YckC